MSYSFSICLSYLLVALAVIVVLDRRAHQLGVHAPASGLAVGPEVLAAVLAAVALLAALETDFHYLVTGALGAVDFYCSGCAKLGHIAICARIRLCDLVEQWFTGLLMPQLFAAMGLLVLVTGFLGNCTSC